MKGNLRSAFNTRQYMQSKDFEAFYYSDLNFQTLPAHTHDYYEFYLFLEGDLDLEISGHARPLHPGDMVLVPPGVSHHALMHSSDRPYRRFVLWVSQEYAARLLKESPDYVFLMQRAATSSRCYYHFHEAEFSSIQSRLIRLLEEFHSNRYGRNAAVYLALNDLLLYMNRIIYEREHPVVSGSGDLMQEITLFIDEHLTEDLSLDVLANHVCLSKYYIAHYFKDSLGISIHQYITKKRLQSCSEAIAAGSDITRTFDEYGFRDYSSFYRMFRKEYGMSPREYQEAHRMNAIHSVPQ
ncbi:helix-turn-helix domain-containing protein [Bacillota bacterium LCP21S3_D9]